MEGREPILIVNLGHINEAGVSCRHIPVGGACRPQGATHEQLVLLHVDFVYFLELLVDAVEVLDFDAVED